jgi:hypothetical protein
LRIIYENPSRNEKEQNFFESFKSLSPTIPEGTWERSERPDYILHTATLRYGLEITTLMVKPTEGQISLAAIRHAQTECLEMARKLAEDRGIPPLEVEVGFRNNRRTINSKTIAQALVTFVESKLNHLGDTGHYYTTDSGMIDVDWVSIQLGTVRGQKWLDYHRWRRNHLNLVNVDPIPLLREAIDKKQEKLQAYLSKCDECWLLVGVDEWTAPEAIYFSEIGTANVYQCGFARLFFLRNIESSLTELKVKAPSILTT